MVDLSFLDSHIHCTIEKYNQSTSIGLKIEIFKFIFTEENSVRKIRIKKISQFFMTIFKE